MNDFKTSLLVKKQFPEYIREDYPKFIAFVEAYYEFLENEYGTNINDLVTESKNSRYYTDLDESLSKFEDYFFNTLLNNFPKSLSITKETLIKNVLPFYKSKGSKQSFEFLFRSLFNEEVELNYPRNNILRLSDGRWTIPKILRTYPDIFSVYDADGNTNVFKICPIDNTNEVRVYVDDVLQSENVDYYIRKEYNKLYFYDFPVGKIKVEYLKFKESLLINREIVGSVSGFRTIIENVVLKSIGLENYYEIQLSNNFMDRFLDYEDILSTVYVGDAENVSVDDESNFINLELKLISGITQFIGIGNRGNSYNVGDPVFIVGESLTDAKAVVESVTTGEIKNIIVSSGGSGFQVGNKVIANSISTFAFDAEVSAVSSTDRNILTSVTLNSDIIEDYLDVVLASADYGFLPNTQININNVISNNTNIRVLTGLGPIRSVQVLNSFLNRRPDLFAESSLIANNQNITIRLSDFGVIGKIDILSGGLNYSIGEQLVFTNTVQDNFYSRGATATVTRISPLGAITGVTINNGGSGYSLEQPPTISVNTLSGNGAILVVSSIAGDNEVFLPVTTTNVFGEIISIKVTDPGSGYKSPPIVDLTQFGSGTATANAEVRNSQIELPGKWITTDGLLSSDKVIEGNDYYTDFTYVLKSKVNFNRYKEVFKNLVHPAGFKVFAEFEIDDFFGAANFTNISINNWIDTTLGIAGLYDGNEGDSNPIGANGYFLVSNSSGLLTVGTYIAVNSDIRIVNSIINNTTITVSQPFSSNHVQEEIVLVDPGYEAIITEYYRELVTEEESVRFGDTVIVVEHSEE